MNVVDDPAWSVAWYLRGYFPLYDELNQFYWERLPERAVLVINPETARRAKVMGRRAGKRFSIERNRRFGECIAHLQNPRVKEYSWVRAEVVRMYEALRRVGLLMTVEAVDERGALAGGLVAIVLPGVLVAETMFTLQPDASKLCLCRTIEACAAAGFSLMDVQTRHDRDPWGEPLAPRDGYVPHPCVRLGEAVWPVAKFMRKFGRVQREAGGSTARVWVAEARQIAAAAVSPEAGAELSKALAESERLRAAWKWLRINVPESVVAEVESTQ